MFGLEFLGEYVHFARKGAKAQIIGVIELVFNRKVCKVYRKVRKCCCLCFPSFGGVPGGRGGYLDN